MTEREMIQAILEQTIGSTNVYYQPPATVKIKYPAVVYKLDRIKKTTANNKWYHLKSTYQATLIYKEPDSPLPYEFAKLDKCEHVSHYMSDNLYHDIYSIEI